MTYGVVDIECSTFQHGSPFAARNKLCVVGLRIEGKNNTFLIEYDSEPYGESLSDLARLLATCSTIVGFNCKFDLAWLARYGIYLTPSQRVFDCQLAYFILDAQRHAFPSLNDCLYAFTLGSKLDIIEREYWSLGIDTPDIPLDVLIPYLHTDLEKTDALYQTLLPLVGRRMPLVRLHMQDLRVLQEMECAGLAMDWAGMAAAEKETAAELDQLNNQIWDIAYERLAKTVL